MAGLAVFALIKIKKNVPRTQVVTIATTAMQPITTVGAGMLLRAHLVRHKAAKVTVITVALKATAVGAGIR